MELSYTALFLASIFSFFFLTLKITNSKKHRKDGGGEPPGPWNLPILGSLHHILSSKLPHHTFRDLSAVYGPIMRLKLGEIPAIVVSSIEGAREIMKTHDIVFATRPNNKCVEALFYGGNNIIFGPHGDLWRHMRRLCTLELLSTKRVRSFRAVREEEVSQLIGSLAPSSGIAVNLSDKLVEISNNITARVVIGSRCDDRELFFSALGDVVQLVSRLSVVELFPSLPFVGRIMGFQSRLEHHGKKLDVMLEKIVEEHAVKVSKNSNVAGNKDDHEALIAEDLTDALLRVQREGNSFQFPISNNNIKAIINFSAGEEKGRGSATAPLDDPVFSSFVASEWRARVEIIPIQARRRRRELSREWTIRSFGGIFFHVSSLGETIVADWRFFSVNLGSDVRLFGRRTVGLVRRWVNLELKGSYRRSGLVADGV